MKTMLRNTLGTLTLLILVTVMMVAPPASLAKMYMSNGNGQQGGGEGDPLDSNDYGSGDGTGGDIVHQRRIIPRGSGDVVFDLQTSGKRLILRVRFQGEVPVFQLEIISDRDIRVEANHVH